MRFRVIFYSEASDARINSFCSLIFFSNRANSLERTNSSHRSKPSSIFTFASSCSCNSRRNKYSRFRMKKLTTTQKLERARSTCNETRWLLSLRLTYRECLGSPYLFGTLHSLRENVELVQLLLDESKVCLEGLPLFSDVTVTGMSNGSLKRIAVTADPRHVHVLLYCL